MGLYFIRLLPLSGVLVMVFALVLLDGSHPLQHVMPAALAAASASTLHGYLPRKKREMSFMPFVGGTLVGVLSLTYINHMVVAFTVTEAVMIAAGITGLAFVASRLPPIMDHHPSGPLTRVPSVGVLVLVVAWPWIYTLPVPALILVGLLGMTVFVCRLVHYNRVLMAES